MEHLFERRFRGQQAQGDIPGSGIGLAIAQDLVGKMQGEIQVSSQEHQGSIFTVVLKRWHQQE
jgi:signal transduction histidine kinase